MIRNHEEATEYAQMHPESNLARCYLELRAEMERVKEERDSFQRVGCAAEAEVQRLRDALQCLLDAQEKYTDRPDWMYACDKARAALRPSSEGKFSLSQEWVDKNVNDPNAPKSPDTIP